MVSGMLSRDIRNSVRSSLAAFWAMAFLFSALRSEAAGKKEGWSVVPLPNISYSTDTGLNLGAFANIYFYGRGEENLYPNFQHQINVSFIWSTKGSWYVHGFFDSKSLVPGLRLTGAVTYKDNYAGRFYGYNGVASPYVPELDQDKSFYGLRRKLFRAMGSVQGTVTGSLRWMGGLVFRRFSLAETVENSLYGEYVNCGLIRSDEVSGGSLLETRGGFVYDTRDIEAIPNRGINAEAYLTAVADLSHRRYHSLSAVLHFRHFVPLGTDKVIFAYHVGYQGLLAGRLPFYSLQELSALYYFDADYEGLGSRYTMRGTMYCRMLANSYLWSNAEFRIRLFQFDLFRQHFDVVTNPFFDTGLIVKPFRLQEQMDAVIGEGENPVWSGNRGRFHCSAGLGLKLHMNSSFVFSFEVARAFNRSLVSGVGMSLSTAYIF